jgi:hypothetical protein
VSLSYSEASALHALTSRAAIADLDARHNLAFADGDVDGWVATFQHSGASWQRGADEPARGARALREAFESFKGRSHYTLDAVVAIDGVNAVQDCRMLVLREGAASLDVQATGRYHDELVYERGAWYFRSRRLVLDADRGR